MRVLKLSGLVTVAAVLLLILVPNVHAQGVQNFTFDSFNADYQLSRAADSSSQMDVNEKLVARFPDFDQNHGILRAIPERYENHSLNLKIISVVDERGLPYHYTISHQNHNAVLKIGDASVFVHGQKTYRLHYKMSDVISFQPGHDVFFWDVNGDQWAQPFDAVNASLSLASDLQNQISAPASCFKGSFGSHSKDCTVNGGSTFSGVPLSFSASSLGPGETLSIRQQFKPGTFIESQAVKTERARRQVSRAVGAGLLLIVPVVVWAFMHRRWRQFGDDPKGRGVIIPEYEPPKGFDSLTADYLYKQSLRPTAITARLLELAVQGLLSITEVPKQGIFGSKDYVLNIERPLDQLSEETRQLLQALFGDLSPGTKLQLSDIKGDSGRRSQLTKALEALEDNLAGGLTSQGYFIKNPKKVKSGYLTWAFLILLAAAGLGFVAFKSEVWALMGLAAGLGLGSLIVFVYAFLMPARSAKGVLAFDAISGLKDYISLAEADRIKFSQSPQGAEKIAASADASAAQSKVKLFEGLLPYAVLFGMEKQWAAQFQGIYKTPPDWYRGNWSTFNAAYLASSIGDFNSAGGQSFSAPSSSSGGGTGGGGGGGGGGGW